MGSSTLQTLQDPILHTQGLLSSWRLSKPNPSIASARRYSKLVVQAAAFGCIPVIVQDGVHMPFEEVLPYDNFAVRVSEKELERLPTILAELAADTKRLARMQDELACAVRSPSLLSRLTHLH
jgi:hypothetical protein